MVKTEDTGKMFEKAVCDAYNTSYNGTYKYGDELSVKLRQRLLKLKELFPECTHTAKAGSRYDFTSVCTTKHLSCKSTKKGDGKVAPQVLGQAQPQKFCETIGAQWSNKLVLKEHIQRNIASILPILAEHTFDCPIVYYNHKESSIRFIELKKPIDWNSYEYSWTQPWNKWKNSTTLKIKNGDTMYSILEVQFHSNGRTNMAIRWNFEKFLTCFKNNLRIVAL